MNQHRFEYLLTRMVGFIAKILPLKTALYIGDLIGDLFFLGHPVLAHFKAYKAGHSLHQRIVHFLINNTEFWKYA